MNKLPEIIMQQANSLPEGTILLPKAFLHLGGRAAIDQAFSRLAKDGHLFRVARGAYVTPVNGRFGKRPPGTEKVVQSLATQTGEIVLPHGAGAANALGLTRQVPVREAYLTSGRTRKLNLGQTEVLIKQAPRWMLSLGGRPAGMAVRALAWMGPEHAERSLKRLHQALPGKEWHTLVAARTALPSWMATAIGKEDLHG